MQLLTKNINGVRHVSPAEVLLMAVDAALENDYPEAPSTEHLDFEYGTVDLPKAIAYLELTLSIEVLVEACFQLDFCLVEMPHRLLSHELALSKKSADGSSLSMSKGNTKSPIVSR